MTNLNGKVALVTGASRGLGNAIAERFALLGADVIVNYASSYLAAQELVKTIEGLGRRAIALKADVSKVSEIDALFEESKRQFSHIDIVVANSGIEMVGLSALEFNEDDFDHIFAVNTKGAIFTLQRAGQEVADHGRIIYIGSSTTAFPMPGHALYGSSKMAPRFFVEVLAKEIGKRGVTVNSILPTATEGAGISTAGARQEVKDFIARWNPMGRMGTVKDCADVAEFLVSDQSSFVSGQHLLVSGGAPA